MVPQPLPAHRHRLRRVPRRDARRAGDAVRLGRSRSGPRVPGQPPDASPKPSPLQIADAVERDPSLDIGRYVRDEFGRDTHQFVVVMADGRVMTNGGSLPQPVVRPLREILAIWRARASGPDAVDSGRTAAVLAGGPRRRARLARPGSRTGAAGRPGRRCAWTGRAGRFGAASRTRRTGARASSTRACAGSALADRRQRDRRRRGRRPAAAAVRVPAFDATRRRSRWSPPARSSSARCLATVIVFGPARRRLRAVEDAARRFGAGDSDRARPGSGRRRGGRGRDGVQLDGRRPRGPRGRAGRVGPRAPAAARRRLARTDHAGHRDARLPRNAHDAGPDARRGARGRATSASSATRPRRLERIIGDLLDLARLEGGGGSFVRRRRAGRAALRARALAARARVRRRRRRHGAHRSHRAPKRSRGDRGSARAGASEPGGQRPRGTRRAARRSRSARDPAADGVTLASATRARASTPAHLPHVFDRFYKAEASTGASRRRSRRQRPRPVDRQGDRRTPRRAHRRSRASRAGRCSSSDGSGAYSALRREPAAAP